MNQKDKLIEATMLALQGKLTEDSISNEKENNTVNSLHVIYRSNITYNNYYNFKKPYTITELKKIKSKINKHEMYIDDIPEYTDAVEVKRKSELIAPIYIMNINEPDEED